MTRSGAREVVTGALLTAFALLIPLLFRGTLQFAIGPYSATLASHVPSMLAMFIGPLVAAMVGLGATAGFLLTLGPVVAARAFIHLIFGVLGAWLYRRGWRPIPVLLAALPVHAAGEALVVRLFGFDPWVAVVVTGGGTVVHHALDAAITLALLRVLARAGFVLARAEPRAGRLAG